MNGTAQRGQVGGVSATGVRQLTPPSCRASHMTVGRRNACAQFSLLQVLLWAQGVLSAAPRGHHNQPTSA
jgi:hypothetical protein